MPKKRKVHSLTGRIDLRLMHQAFKAVKRNRGAAGIDKVSIKMFEANLDENLVALKKDLKAGTFRPRPLRRKMIPKGPGTSKLRPLGIPVVRDRVAQEVIRRLLAPIFEPQFHDASFGFIPKRNCHQAIQRVLELHGQGYRVVLDADIQGFFDNIPHQVIMTAVAAEVADGNILRLVEKFLTAGVMENGVFKPTTIGTPQGGVISPLLANIVLNHLDWKLHEAGYRFARYADDFVVVCQTRQQAQEALTLVKHVLETDLGLFLSPHKTEITTYGKGYQFLGFFLSSRSRRMRDKSVQKFKAKVRELTIRKRNLDQKAIAKLNQVIRGTAQYFGTSFSTNRWNFQKLDSWIRMRLRGMKLKRKNYNDNRKLRVGYFRRKLGLLTLEEFCTYFDRHGKAHRVIPRRGATSIGVAR
ncbi:MAG: group II intron reverse transcriptase/maturase [Planctomycetes bacterium]|nr:group II intron reverse transcriptase/maturase [Planctomycetota bacterium]MBL7044370.1 group II intron reverse transcriptase/maturase [Pirellulaceae bacterium]